MPPRITVSRSFTATVAEACRWLMVGTEVPLISTAVLDGPGSLASW